jgi:FHS family L-fucose permease-like MFS transporter
VDPAFALFVNGIGLVVFSILTATIPGKGRHFLFQGGVGRSELALALANSSCLPFTGGIACLFIIFFFESICYPVIFTVATADLGLYAKLGSGLIAA